MRRKGRSLAIDPPGRAGKADPGFTPGADMVRRFRSFIAAELMLVPIVIICAAAMARFGAF